MIELEKIEEPKKGPFVYFLVVFLIFLLVLMIVPYYSVKNDPEPSKIIELDELLENAPKNGFRYEFEFLSDVGKYYVSDLIKYAADKISKSCNERSEVCYTKSLFYFVRDKIDYISDPEREYIESPEGVVLSGAGDCEDKVVLLLYLLKAINIKSRIVLIEKHAYLDVYLPSALKSYKREDNWVSLDPSCKSCGFGEIPAENLDKERKFLYFEF